MPSNTTNLEGYTVFSSLSLAGSGATAQVQDLTARGATSVVSLAIAGASFSIQTAGAATSGVDGGLVVVFRASGVSLCYKSGSSIYLIGGSATSGAA